MTLSGKRHVYALFLIALLYSFHGAVYAQGNQPAYYEISFPGNQIAYDLSTLPYDNVVLVGQHQDDQQSATLGWLYIMQSDGSEVSQYRYQEPGYSVSFKGIDMF